MIELSVKRILKRERLYGILIGALLTMIANAIALGVFYAIEHGYIFF